MKKQEEVDANSVYYVVEDHETRKQKRILVFFCLIHIQRSHTPRLSERDRAGLKRGFDEGVCTEQIFTKILIKPIRPNIPNTKAHQYS
jgi:hypothetical protein